MFLKKIKLEKNSMFGTCKLKKCRCNKNNMFGTKIIHLEPSTTNPPPTFLNSSTPSKNLLVIANWLLVIVNR